MGEVDGEKTEMSDGKPDIAEYDFTRAVMLLDCALDALEVAAEREKRREAGKSLRSITEQERAKTTREFLAEMDGKYSDLLPFPLSVND